MCHGKWYYYLNRVVVLEVEHINSNYASDIGLISQICKELKRLYTSRKEITQLKVSTDVNTEFLKDET